MPQELNTEHINLRIPSTLKKRIDDIAEIEGLKSAVIYRRALERYAASFFSSPCLCKGTNAHSSTTTIDPS